MSESMALVGVDAHQAQSVAAGLDSLSGELRVERLCGAPAVVEPAFLERWSGRCERCMRRGRRQLSQAGFHGGEPPWFRRSRGFGLGRGDAPVMPRGRKYPQELLDRGVRLVFELGRPVAQVAADLGIHSETLRRRVRQAEADIRKLRRENYELRRARRRSSRRAWGIAGECPTRW